MAPARRIGKREYRCSTARPELWDRDISGFGARRQIDAISYVLIYRTAEGDSDGTQSVVTARHGRLTRPAKKQSGSWAAWRAASILPR